MAQLRRYPNVLPPHLGSHNMNGNSERVDQREKAKIARVQSSDADMNKKPNGPLFPPPRKVSDSSDEVAKTIKKSLGDYSNFVKIMNQEVSREKAPGQTCIGVMPAPATPTENKTHSFPSAVNKTKTKDKPSNSTQERPKGVSGIEKLDQKAKPDQKHKSSSDAARHKPLKLGEKLNDKKENKDSKKISLDKYKNNQTSVADKSTTLSTNKHKLSAKDEVTSHNKVQEASKDVEKIVKKEETCETSQTELTKKNEHSTTNPKAKPPHLQLPSRCASSSSQLQSPLHRDMKLQNILKEMTESVNMPLTGICTPLPKQDSRFPFPSNVVEKENSQVSSDPTNSFMKDFDLSDDDDSDDEREDDDENNQRPAGQTRSRSSSSSSSSSSGESSDSEDEEVEDDKTKVVPRTSMLNSPPVPSIKTPSPPTQPVPTLTQPQTSFKSAVDEMLGKSRTSSIKLDESNLSRNCTKEETKETKSAKEELKGTSDKLDEQVTQKTSTDKVDASLLSAGQKHAHSVNKTKVEHREKLPDTKIRIKVEKSNDSFRVKTDSKLKADTKKRTESESKQVSGEVKSISEKGKTSEKSSEPISKTSRLGVKKKTLNGVVKVKNSSQSKETEKKDKKLDTVADKRKHKDSTGETTGKPVKDKSDLNSSKEKKSVSKDKAELQAAKDKTEELSSKDTNRTKSSNKQKKMSDRRESFGFDSPDVEEEESAIIDVVGDDSPATKKKKTDSSEKKNGLNGVHKNGHVDMPLDIQLVHDKDKDPTSLIVKIPLSFLKRIPSKFAENISVENSHPDVELGSLENVEKKPEHWSQKKNGKNGNMLVELSDEMKNSKHVNNNGKRSPSWDSNHLPCKRVRRDSQPHEQKKRKTTAELNAECEADIKKDEPDTHLRHAKTLKREADKLTDKEAKSRTYVEAIVRFICCGKALEDKDDGENRAAQMYSETNELLRFILKHVLSKTEDKRLLILCLRVQSLLLSKLYRMKGKQAVRNTQILAEHFKATHKNNITSPYASSVVNNKHGSTPSPLSPTPSPAGSIGSIGSNGSNSSNEGNHTHNGRQASTASVTSPVSISIPQRIHSVMAQHVSSTSKLVNSIDMWDRADSLSSDYQEFFTTVDSICGALTFHSSIPHVVNYVKNSLSNFHEHGKRT